MITLHPEMVPLANESCKNCEDTHSVGLCGIAVLLRINAGRWLARGNMHMFEATKKDYMTHTRGD